MRHEGVDNRFVFVLREVFTFLGERSGVLRTLPHTIFTDPQLRRAGLSATEARKQGRAAHVATMPMCDVARAVEVDETRGFVKAVVAAESDQILGFAALGLVGGEIMAAVQISMMGNPHNLFASIES